MFHANVCCVACVHVRQHPQLRVCNIDELRVMDVRAQVCVVCYVVRMLSRVHVPG